MFLCDMMFKLTKFFALFLLPAMKGRLLKKSSLVSLGMRFDENAAIWPSGFRCLGFFCVFPPLSILRRRFLERLEDRSGFCLTRETFDSLRELAPLLETKRVSIIY